MNTSLPVGPPVNYPTLGCVTTMLFAGAVWSAINASDFVERKTKQAATESVKDEYDIIIVGGGSAGCVLANRLSEVHNWTVLLLEAGRDEPIETKVPAWFPIVGTSSLNWQFRAQPEPESCNGMPCPVYAGKCLGGGSAINGMMYVRGNKLDYDEWASMGNEGWSYDDVLPFFLKSERNWDEEITNNTTYHSTEGLQDVQCFQNRGGNIDVFHKGLSEMGYETKDINGPNQTNYVFVTQSTSFTGERRSTNLAFLKPSLLRKNLTVETFAQVIKVLIDNVTKTAIGVEYVGSNGRNRTVKAKLEVVLSAGAINSPKLLMLSGVGPKEHLGSVGIETLVDLEGVGQNLQDHVTAIGVEYLLSKTNTNTNVLGRIEDFLKYQERDLRLFHQGTLASNGMLQLTAFFKSKYQKQDDRPDIQLTFFSPLPPVGVLCTNYPRMLDMAYYDRIVVTPILLHPKSRGQVLLNSSDPLESPLIYQHYFNNSLDVKVLLEGLKEGTRLSDTEIFNNMGVYLDKVLKKGCDQFEYDYNEYWECIIQKYTWTIMHVSGTCKMGPDTDKTAVVDSRLRVKGVKNLRVIDASIMPLIVGGNLNAPTIMIGEKGAAYIKEDHGIKN